MKQIQYTNKDQLVTLFPDGTKIRIPLLAIYPGRFETVDIKITNYCDAGCSYCHENSTVKGKHAELETLKLIIDNCFEKYSEIAIGGGNPLSYPYLISFLEYCKRKSMIANMTINSFHINSESVSRIADLISAKFVYNIGISYSEKYFKEAHSQLISKINQNNIVYHFILGIDNFEEIIEKYDLKKVLILGYKMHGRGRSNGLKIINTISEKYDIIKKYIESKDIQWCFDTLAVEQLKLNKDTEFYMGDEGENSLYIDAVKKEYTQSSYSSKRLDLNLKTFPAEFYLEFDNNKKLGKFE